MAHHSHVDQPLESVPDVGHGVGTVEGFLHVLQDLSRLHATLGIGQGRDDQSAALPDSSLCRLDTSTRLGIGADLEVEGIAPMLLAESHGGERHGLAPLAGLAHVACFLACVRW